MATKVPNNLLSTNINVAGYLGIGVPGTPVDALVVVNGRARIGAGGSGLDSDGIFGMYYQSGIAQLYATTNPSGYAPIVLTASRFELSNGSVGIGTSSPNAAALLQVDSTTKGFLPPRMTTAQRDAISSPPAGLIIFNTDLGTLQTYA